MGFASYDYKAIRTSSGWSSFQNKSSSPTIGYVNCVGNYIQLRIDITTDNSSEYISKIRVEYQLFGYSSAAYNVTPYLLVSDSQFTGSTVQDLNNQARSYQAHSPVYVPANAPTSDIDFTLDFTTSPLDFINKSKTIYLLIATSEQSTNVMSCTVDYGSVSGPGVYVDFANELSTYTVRCYTDWDTEAINTYIIDEGTNFQVPDGPTREDEETANYSLIPQANGGILPSIINNGSYIVSTEYSFKNWYCQEDEETYRPLDIYTKQIDTHFIAQWNTTDVSNVTAPYSPYGNPTKESTSTKYKNIYYNLNYTEHMNNVLLDQEYTDTVSYSFKGWYTTATGNTLINNATFTKNSNVYAQYSESSHTRTSVQLPRPSRSGYILKGYSDSASSTTIIVSPGGYYTPNSNNDVVLYAVWEADSNIINVTFNSHGGESQFDSHSYTVGEKYNPLPTCNRDGYDFLGWFTSASGGTQITTSTTVSTSLPNEFHAQWIRYVNTTFNSNGGNAPSFSTHKYRYTEYYNPLPTCTRSGYSFTGWYTDPTNGTRIYTSTPVGDSTRYTELYAHWSRDIKSVSVTFKVDGADYSVENYSYPGKYNPLPVLPDKEGYAKIGWFTSASGGTEITTSTDTIDTPSRIFYARYSLSSITVTFNANGGTVNPETKSFEYGSTYGELPVPTLSGSSFVGWFTSASGGTKINSTDNVTYTSNVTFYAHWISTYNYRLSFNINGGEGTVPSTITADNIAESSYKATWTIPVGITTPGWKGWATSPTTTTPLPGGTELNEYTLTYNSSIDSSGTVSRTLYAIYDDTPVIVDTNSVRIYTGSSFVKATPYVYYNGKWNKATAYVYSNGWKKGV